MDDIAPCKQVYRQRVSVPLEYVVCFTRGVFRPDNPTLAETIGAREPSRRHRIMAIVDGGLAAAWPDLTADIARYCERHASALELITEPRVIPGGEQAKQSLPLIEGLAADMHRYGVDRHSFVIAVGGGAVLDAAGFAAAVTHRGVRLVRVPTTVLAQNDSGVGVKNGINAFNSKNFLGTFAAPFAVINDSEFLRTLEPRDSRAGMAESVKVALIRDPDFFGWLEQNTRALAAFSAPELAYLIQRGAEIHMHHIATGGDPFEQGSSRPLDFGHWAAHKLESLTDHALRHGEAVAIGMALDSRYSAAQGLLAAADAERVCALLEALGFTLWHDALARLGADEKPLVLDGLREFREHMGGELTVTLLQGIGRGAEVHHMDEETIIRCLGAMQARHAARVTSAT